MNLPDGMKATITVIWKEQDKTVRMWKELEEEWFKFKWKGVYLKGRLTFKIGYKEDLKTEFFREIKFDEVKVEKPKRKKRIKPAQKNKKK